MKTAGRVLKFYGRIIAECIPLFISAGLLTVLACSLGLPEGSRFYQLPGVLYSVIIPVYAGSLSGKKCGGDGGGLAGTLAASAVVIAGSAWGMTAAVIAGGAAGYLYRKGMEKGQDKIPAGFEMLAGNLYLIGTGLAAGVLAELLLLPAVSWFGEAAGSGIFSRLDIRLLPLVSLAVEPLKILFLNNGLNHGLLVPLGMEAVRNGGSSILFLLETNPGPGFGILAAYAIVRRKERKPMTSSLVIQLLGGIHEIYFPYVLSDIRLLAAAVAGGIAGNYCFLFFGSGLFGPASPGSVVTILLMADGRKWPGLLAGILVSAAVSCLAACLILAEEKKKSETAESPIMEQQEETMEKTIYFVCDAGMGSSAMASALFKRKLKAEGVEHVRVFHVSADSIPEDADAIVCQKNFASSLPAVSVRLFTVDHLTEMSGYEELMDWIKGGM